MVLSKEDADRINGAYQNLHQQISEQNVKINNLTTQLQNQQKMIQVLQAQVTGLLATNFGGGSTTE